MRALSIGLFLIFAGIILFEILIASSLWPEAVTTLKTVRVGALLSGFGLLVGTDVIFRYVIQSRIAELKEKAQRK